MTVPVSSQTRISVLKVHGYIERVMAQQFEYVIDACLSEQRQHIIVDLSDAEYLSSSGWGIFIGELKRIRAVGGDLILAAMQPNVKEVFELLEFHRVIDSYDSVDQAVRIAQAHITD